MPLQIEVYASSSGLRKHIRTDRYCSGQCLDMDGWTLEDAEPCDLGEFTCCDCGERFTVDEMVPKAKYLKITGESGYLFWPMSEGIRGGLEFIAEDLSGVGSVGDTFTIEVVEIPQEAVDAMSEFEGF